MGGLVSFLAEMQAKLSLACRQEEGTTAIEYALIAGGLSLAIASTVFALGPTLVGFFETIANSNLWP